MSTLTDCERVAGRRLLADGDAVPRHGRIRLRQQAPSDAILPVAHHRGAGRLLVGLHPAEALAVGGGGLGEEEEEEEGGAEVVPGVARYPVALKIKGENHEEPATERVYLWIRCFVQLFLGSFKVLVRNHQRMCSRHPLSPKLIEIQ